MEIPNNQLVIVSRYISLCELISRIRTERARVDREIAALQRHRQQLALSTTRRHRQDYIDDATVEGLARTVDLTATERTLQARRRRLTARLVQAQADQARFRVDESTGYWRLVEQKKNRFALGETGRSVLVLFLVGTLFAFVAVAFIDGRFDARSTATNPLQNLRPHYPRPPPPQAELFLRASEEATSHYLFLDSYDLHWPDVLAVAPPLVAAQGAIHTYLDARKRYQHWHTDRTEAADVLLAGEVYAHLSTCLVPRTMWALNHLFASAFTPLLPGAGPRQQLTSAIVAHSAQVLHRGAELQKAHAESARHLRPALSRLHFIRHHHFISPILAKKLDAWTKHLSEVIEIFEDETARAAKVEASFDWDPARVSRWVYRNAVARRGEAWIESLWVDMYDVGVEDMNMWHLLPVKRAEYDYYSAHWADEVSS